MIIYISVAGVVVLNVVNCRDRRGGYLFDRRSGGRGGLIGGLSDEGFGSGASVCRFVIRVSVVGGRILSGRGRRYRFEGRCG